MAGSVAVVAGAWLRTWNLPSAICVLSSGCTPLWSFSSHCVVFSHCLPACWTDVPYPDVSFVDILDVSFVDILVDLISKSESTLIKIKIY